MRKRKSVLPRSDFLLFMNKYVNVMIKKYLFSILSLLTCFIAQAQVQTQTDLVPFTYANFDNGIVTWGTGKKEVVDIAMHCSMKQLEGCDMQCAMVRFQKTPHVKNVKFWLSKELNLEQNGSVKVNKPDVVQVDATIDSTGVEMVAMGVLSTPYKLTADGVYVGLTYEVDEIDGNSGAPVICANEKNAGAFFVHSTRRFLKWFDNGTLLPSPSITAYFSGLPQNRAELQADSVVYVKTGEESTIPLTIVNYGMSEISKVGFNGTINGKTISTYVDLVNKLPAALGAKATIHVAIPAFDADGAYPVNLTLSRINDQSNVTSDATADFTIDSRALYPIRRPLMEEYTGTWCGYCPRGYVALAAMKRIYGDAFTAIAYHNGNHDPMEADGIAIPADVDGFPAAKIDRGVVTDPYYGIDESSDMMAIEQEWLAAGKVYAPVDVKVSAQLSEDGTKVEAQSVVTSPRDLTDANYAVEYVLVADSLHGESAEWWQSNYYATDSPDAYPEPEFKLFAGTASKVKGLYYDDVALASTAAQGKDAQLPAVMTAYVGNTTRASFDIFSIVDVESHQQIVQSRKQLRVVAIVKDASANGRVLNTAECHVDASTYFTEGIHHISADANAATSDAYDLSGRRVTNPSKGFYIVDGKKVIK